MRIFNTKSTDFIGHPPPSSVKMSYLIYGRYLTRLTKISSLSE